MAGVQSIERAFAILRVLSVQPAGVTEIAERVALPKSTVARLLNALEFEGAVEQVAIGGAYRLGAAIEEMAGGSSQGKSLIAAARPFLLDLDAQTGETSGLDIYEDRRVHFMDMVESNQDVQVRDWTGESGPAHSVSAGIVILAHLDAATVDDYIAVGSSR